MPSCTWTMCCRPSTAATSTFCAKPREPAPRESAAEAGVPRDVLERAALPELLGKAVPRRDGPAPASAAAGRAPLRRVRGGPRVLRQAPRRGDVAPGRAL